MGHAPLSWPFPDGYPDVASSWVNANYQVLRWNVYGNFVQGNTWKAPSWENLLPVRETNLDKQIDQISQILLKTKSTLKEQRLKLLNEDLYLVD